VKRTCFVILLFAVLFAVLKHQGAWAARQTQDNPPAANPWQDVTREQLNRASARRAHNLTQARYLRLDRTALAGSLEQAPRELTPDARARALLLALPYPDGTFKTFRVVESLIMAPELAAQFPEIKTYVADSPDDPTASARLDLTPQGFHAQILSQHHTIYIDPLVAGNADTYQSYYRKDLPAVEGWQCETKPAAAVSSSSEQGLSSDQSLAPEVSNGGNLRTFRLAVAATGEYTTFNGGTVALALAAITTTMNRVNGIFERDLAVRMTLVANNNLIIYTNGATDPYTNGNVGAMIGENQTNLNNVIGAANYDIGHVFGTSGFFAGVATRGVCNDSIKGRGVSTRNSPAGDAFDVVVVAHEMGHQFGANHTYNGTSANCGANRNAATAYEPGSGSTIMGYAATCAPETLQAMSDDYFHVASLEEMTAFINNSATCATQTANGNTPPAVIAGASYTIPISTPFTLTATGNDANGDALTYCWEQYNLGAPAPPNTDDGTRPIFRSFPPTASPARTFPRLSDLLNNTTTLGESLPTTTRTLTFQVTARDNRANGGAINSDKVNLNTTSTAGPFVVTSPNTAVSWAGGSTQTVTWNVANTNASPVNCAQVKISLSFDGGQTFPWTLLSNAPNSGSASVTLPNINTSQARIKVEALNNIFFDVSNTNFTITSICVAGTGTVSGGGVICAGSTATVTVTVSLGVSPFTVRLSNGAQQTGAFGQTVFNFTVNPATTTTYTVAAGSQDAFGCALKGSGSATVQVNAITPGASPSVLQGVTSATLSYSFSGNVNQYSIDYDATANAAGFVDVTNAALNVAPFVLSIPGGAAPGTYNATLSARNSSSGCTTAAVPFTVTIAACPTLFTVNSLGDTPDASPGDRVCADNGGNCTLRAAIQEANALTPCAALTIDFSVNGAINLATALPDPNHPNLWLKGPGANLLTVQRSTANGTPNFGLFIVNSGKQFKLSGLTISNGNTTSTGGALFNNGGNTTIEACTMSGNASTRDGGALTNQNGTLNISNSTISNNTSASGGGGILSISNGVATTTTLTNCTLNNNTSSDGGGILTGASSAAATTTLTNCTINNNTATTNGGGILSVSNGPANTTTLTSCTLSGNTASTNGGAIVSISSALVVNNSTINGNRALNNTGGGIFNQNGTATLTNCTLSGNSGTGGGGITNFATSSVTTMLMTNCTIADNTATVSGLGGGIRLRQGGTGSVTLQFRNSLFANNSDTNVAVFGAPATLTSLGNNLSSDGTGNLTAAGDLPNTNPLLGQLLNNGGPTQTHALLPGSPALNAGNNCVLTNSCPSNNLGFNLTTDQRGTGFNRKVGSQVDIGAFEANYLLEATGGNNQTPVVNTAFAQPLQAKLTESGQPVSGVLLSFSAPMSGASASFPNGNTATTDSAGQASVSATANGVTGPYQVTASAPGMISAAFNLTNTCAALSATVSGGGTICPTGTAQVIVTVSGGRAPYTVTLNNGGGTQTGTSNQTQFSFNVSPASTTTYSLASSTDANGCAITGSSSATVTVVSPPTFTPTSQSFAANGGTGSIAISFGGSCAWSASTSDGWISFPQGNSGSGNGTLSFQVAAHTNTARRVGSITINGQSFAVLQGANFLDVPETHPFYSFIGKLSARGITLGCGNGNYCPTANVTREQMAAFLIRALGVFNPPPPATQRFADVPSTNPFYAFIEEMAVRQITAGCGGGNYCPTANVTREQMAAFIIRALHTPGYVPPAPATQRFPDVPPSNPFYAHIEEMAVRQITLGCGGGNYCPTAVVTREQMAAFLVRAFNL
jgi:CSLREA domain-containing protein